MHTLTIRRHRGQHRQPPPPSARASAARRKSARKSARDAGVTAWVRRLRIASAPRVIPPIARAASTGAVVRFVLAAGGRGPGGEPRCPQCSARPGQGCRHLIPAGLHDELRQALDAELPSSRGLRPVSIARFADGPDGTIVVDARIPAPPGGSWRQRALTAQIDALAPPAGRHAAPQDGVFLEAPLAPLPEPLREWRPRAGVAGNVPVTYTRPAPAGPPPEELRDHVATVLARPARSQIGSWVDEVLADPRGRWPHLQREWQDSTGSFAAVTRG